MQLMVSKVLELSSQTVEGLNADCIDLAEPNTSGYNSSYEQLGDPTSSGYSRAGSGLTGLPSRGGNKEKTFSCC